MNELLTAEQMADADRRAVALGVPSLTLMENAGRAVADEAAKMAKPGARVAVLCGPGNNGGDGFVAARILAERGFDVTVYLFRPLTTLKGDTAAMAARWTGRCEPLAAFERVDFGVVLDAVFGTGLSRPLDHDDRNLLWRALIIAASQPLLAVDVPSGVDPTTGAAAEWAVPAARTVTFFRRKTGHMLYPARALCGDIVVADIGIPDDVATEVWPRARINHPPLATDVCVSNRTYPLHKYTRGHALVVSGPPFQTGAARLSARAALRIGAGLVTVAGSSSATTVNAAHLSAIMLAVCNGAKDLRDILADTRKNAVLIGPGAGVGEETCELVDVALASGASVVIDADALTSFALSENSGSHSVGFGFTSHRKSPVTGAAALFAAIKANASRPVVLTPHEGEFRKVFGDLPGSKLDRARAAAEMCGAIVVLKGADTVIAQPDGFAVINANAPATLATAGSGDVLAGFIVGLLANKRPAFDAACAAVWLHGECANLFGPGLIAEDLPEVLPRVLTALQASSPGT
jgi:ADP-dependent NAD(P)H-hydrate dehydratase / NAD(P)H-hydrate epimerase